MPGVRFLEVILTGNFFVGSFKIFWSLSVCKRSKTQFAIALAENSRIGQFNQCLKYSSSVVCGVATGIQFTVCLHCCCPFCADY